VRLIKWNTDNDTFEHGQWFNGRIYERRCDLSPKGDKLIYFAAKMKQTKFTRHYSWTAISQPPWLKALALWPKGDCWHGGGLFDDAKNVWLNHFPQQAHLESGFALKKLIVTANPRACGEDEPVLWRRLKRDGWTLRQEGEFESKGLTGGWPAKSPEIWEKPEKRKRFTLQMRRVGIGADINGEWNSLEFEIFDKEGRIKFETGRASWADWDHRNHLVYVKAGKIYRLDLRMGDDPKPSEIADFNDQKPTVIKAPPHAQTW
jgi:hypothetical protein